MSAPNAAPDSEVRRKDGHVPVMLAEVIAALAPKAGAVYVDATFGGGGYATALLEAAPRARVYGIDRDPAALAEGAPLARRFEGRLALIHGRFGDMAELLAGVGTGAGSVDGIAFDLGVSSMHLDDPKRGFSFRADGPLDMRMNAADSASTAADVVNNLSEAELADIIRRFGEEKLAARIARAIAAARARAPIQRTGELAEIVRRVVPRARDGIDPATRTFQALRIHVNDELGEIERGLAAAETLLKAGGRLAVVSFHSLEDRAVKTFLAERSGRVPAPSRHQPIPRAPASKPTFRLVAGLGRPSGAEIAANPRARSARLRAAERTDAPPRTGAERRAA
ncbi:MAG: 16S rRNA (cytosine(1402)-N(4))-methyltransferase RsmH [Rhodospirillales bacterium]|nr:16S rRNA (cytosine(1402)-N(4))-methyltransferase RsmH [Rhodospirillales bacterium]